MKTTQKHSTDKLFYITGLVLGALFIVLCVLQNAAHTDFDITKIIPPCLFRRLSGLCCPGCGGTRAIKALLAGRLVTCFFYHPFVLYCAILYVLFMVSRTISLFAQKKSSHKSSSARGFCFTITYVYIGIFIILLQWMIKNALILFSY